jgi:hypothetical protein
VNVEQAHIMSVIQHPSVKSINDIKLTLHTTFYIPTRRGNIAITGCIVKVVTLSSDNFIFCIPRCCSHHNNTSL